MIAQCRTSQFCMGSMVHPQAGRLIVVRVIWGFVSGSRYNKHVNVA